MSIEPPVLAQPPVPTGKPLTMKEVAALLVKHYALHEGKFDLLVEYQFGAGAFGPTPESVNPGVMIGIAKLGLTQSAQPGPLTVDAAEVNPPPTRSRRKRA